MKLRWSRLANADLIHIWRRVADDSPGAATELVMRLDARCELLRTQPRMGPLRGGTRKQVRQLTEGEYLIFYRVGRDAIEVLRVVHGRRDPSEW